MDKYLYRKYYNMKFRKDDLKKSEDDKKKWDVHIRFKNGKIHVKYLYKSYSVAPNLNPHIPNLWLSERVQLWNVEWNPPTPFNNAD